MYIEQQLEDQKKLLYLDIPTLRNHNSLMRKLRLNPRSEIDLTQLEKQSIGNSPLHKKYSRRFLSQTTADVDKRSGVDENMFVNKSTEHGDDLNGSSESRTHNVSFNTDGGYANPLAYSINDLDDAESAYSDEEEYQRSLIIDNQEIFIGAMPTPTLECGPSIAVWNWSMSINFFYCLDRLKRPKQKRLKIFLVWHCMM